MSTGRLRRENEIKLLAACALAAVVVETTVSVENYDRSAVSELVTELVSPAEHATLERLWQLYRHDRSEFRDSHPDQDGLFAQRRLEPVLGGRPGSRRSFAGTTAPSGSHS